MFSFLNSKNSMKPKKINIEEIMRYINNTLIVLKREISFQDKNLLELKTTVCRLYKEKQFESAKRNLKMIRIIENTVERLQNQVILLETKRMACLQEIGNREIYNVISLINHEDSRNGINTIKLETKTYKHIDILSKRDYNEEFLFNTNETVVSIDEDLEKFVINTFEHEKDFNRKNLEEILE
ncbi:hypothetical protein CWI38_0184p0030 [Hamiltosporidium tvaerminnensis]|uniref:Uncharacterized protein n=2 Tax=Hamiltosporidium TaxID=1176354 RepID=A0A4Q9LAR4_9MICR|nr:hypothetical protein CWI39_0757p0010 [Hamiltosporidium magnivora]TBU19861.1 hypothetical protein CWI38_0184p0030 [Hamiltosporidium tvaerminnensis]